MTFRDFWRRPVVSHPGEKPKPSQARFRPQPPPGFAPQQARAEMVTPYRHPDSLQRPGGAHACLHTRSLWATGLHTHTPVDVCLSPDTFPRWPIYSSVSVAPLLGQTGCHRRAELPSDPQAHLSAPPHTTNHTLQAASVCRGPLSPSFFLLTAAVRGEGVLRGRMSPTWGGFFPILYLFCPSFFSHAKWALLWGGHILVKEL